MGYGVSTQRLTGNSKFIKYVTLADYGLVQSITDLNLLQLSTVPGDHFEVIMTMADNNHLLYLWTCVHLDNNHLNVVSLLEK